jgi:hypothetical protein
MSDIQELVRERAYELWRQAGVPEGRSAEFWFAAENELEYGESEYEAGAADGEAGTFIPAVDEPPAVVIDLGAPTDA